MSNKSSDNKSNQIGEVTVYSKRKYLDTLKKQQEKYLADMAKYKQDSVEWVIANKAYQDSLNLYNNSYDAIKKGDGYKHLYKYVGKPRSEYPFSLSSTRKIIDEIGKFDATNPKYINHSNGILTKSEVDKEVASYGNRDYNYVKDGYADIDWFTGIGIPDDRKVAIQRYKSDDKNTDWDTHSLDVINYTKKYGKKPEYILRGPEADMLPLFKKPIKEPILVDKPKIEQSIKYDPTYENIKMRSLWANKAKADTTARIGVLNPLDYNDDSKGFTIGEAMRTFPPEILEDNKIDMINNQINKKKLAKGGIIPSSNIRFNNTPNTDLIPVPNKAFTTKEFAKGRTYLDEYNKLVADENNAATMLKDSTLNSFQVNKLKGKLVDIAKLKNDLYKHQSSNEMALGGLDAASTVLSMGTTAATLLNQAEENRNQRTIKETLENKQRFENDSAFLKDFNTSGSATEFFAKGGNFKINVRTHSNISNFKPIANNMFEVDGAKHENGGVKMGDKEVEDGEVIKVTPEGIKVLSDRDEYFGYSPADNAKDNPMAFETEFNKQEIMKGNKNKGNKAALGADWTYNLQKLIADRNYKNMNVQDNNGISMLDFADKNFTKSNAPFYDPAKSIATITPDRFTPDSKTLSTDKNVISTNNVNNTNKESNMGNLPYFIDNVTNAITTLATPKVIPPSMIPSVKLNSDVDVNPMINSIKGNERSSINFINKNISDSNVATAAGIGVGNQATGAVNDIRSKEFNIENQIKNEQAKQNMIVNIRNTDAINNFSDQHTMRQLGINSAINENINNLSRDFIDIRDKANLADKDNKKLDIQLAMDTEGYLAPLIKSGQFNSVILDTNFDLSKLSAANRKAVAEARAINNMRRNGK